MGQQWWQVSGVIVTKIERERQRSREGEIRIIDPADHEDVETPFLYAL